MINSRIHTFFYDPIRSFQAMHILRQAAVFISGIVLAASHWSIDEIGAFEWLFFLGYSLTYFWISGILQGFLANKKPYNNRSSSLFWSVFFVLLGLGVITWIIFLLIGLLTADEYGLSTYTFLLFGGWICFNVVSSFLPYILYVRYNVKWLNTYNALYFTGYLSIFIGLYILGFGWYVLLMALFIFGLLQLIALIGAMLQIKPFILDFSTLKSLWVEFLPLIGYVGIGGLATVFDGWLIHFYFGEAEIFAVYRYGARELPLSLTLAAALSHAIVPYISDNQEDGLSKLKLRSKRLMHVVFPVSILLLLLSDDVFRLLYADRFSESVPIFDIMLLLVISRLIFSHTILIAKKANILIFKVSLLELGLNILLSLILIRWMGIGGVVLASIVAYAFEKFIYGVIVKKSFAIPLRSYISVPTWLGYSTVILITFLLKYV